MVQQYDGVSRIVSDINNNLAIQPKSEVNDINTKNSFFFRISGALQHVKMLSKIVKINKVELEICL